MARVPLSRVTHVVVTVPDPRNVSDHILPHVIHSSGLSHRCRCSDDAAALAPRLGRPFLELQVFIHCIVV